MSHGESSETFVQLLERAQRDSGRAVDEVIGLVYGELRALAAHHLGREEVGHTLQPTALVHEVYLRMLDQREVGWESRLHFLRIAAQQIRRILVDHARGKNRIKRGGDLLRVTLTESGVETDEDVDFLDLDLALDRLDEKSSDDRSIVELKFFAGLTEPEIASVLGIGERTVRRRWQFIRTWLFRELSGAEDTET